MVVVPYIKKQNPRKGTETLAVQEFEAGQNLIKKQNPRKGTETPLSYWTIFPMQKILKNKIPVRGRKPCPC